MGYLNDLWKLGAPGGLPVELLFSATAKNNSLVRCGWATASGLNNDYFAIERATNLQSFG